ncbi:MAG: hypothetical protein A2096_07800 [Spirochaetes bacterium GWF1_41_5]|nr:MAG: hypothetical protein A2096_07800 [Spirochaetes bacterium GWF1_41_5]HBE01679.1 hypothetical protein [Spirochaetia bacterium]
MIIDVHEHFGWEQNYLKLLLESMDKGGIDKTCLSPLPPCFESPDDKEVLKAAQSYPDRIIPFGYIRLGEDSPKTVSQLRERGFKGLKIHTPPLNYDDPSFFPVYAAAEEAGLPILFHTGAVAVKSDKNTARYNISSARMRPIFIDSIAKAFPDLKIIMAHLGMPWHDEAIIVLRYNPNVFADLAIGHNYGVEDYSRSFFQRAFAHPADLKQLVFGGSHFSHSNWILQKRYYELFDFLHIPEEIQKKILAGNIQEMLKI